MIALVGSILGASLLGSPHCAAMCGGFVCFYAADHERRSLALHLAYHAGRLCAYSALGMVAGALGHGIESAGTLVGIGRAAAVVAGALMVVWGVSRMLAASGIRTPLARQPGFASAGYGGVLRALRDRPPVARALVVGILSALLPCGWLYAFVAAAAATGSVAAGAVVMAAFWAGTVPILAGLGLATQRLLGPFRSRLPVMSAAVVVVLGLLTIAGKMRPTLSGAAVRCETHGRR